MLIVFGGKGSDLVARAQTHGTLRVALVDVILL